jgi:hypothetical protein
MKFKMFWIRYRIFLILRSFSYETSVCVHFSPEFHPGAGFPGEHVVSGFLGAPAVVITMLEQPHFTFEGTRVDTKFRDTKFRIENYFRISRNFYLISRNFAEISQPYFAK